jgi:hypothetical protein
VVTLYVNAEDGYLMKMTEIYNHDWTNEFMDEVTITSRVYAGTPIIPVGIQPLLLSPRLWIFKTQIGRITTVRILHWFLFNFLKSIL